MYSRHMYATTITNIAAIPSVCWHAYKRYYTESVIILSSAIASTLYHLCFDADRCVIDNKMLLQQMDFFFAYMIVISCILHVFLHMTGQEKYQYQSEFGVAKQIMITVTLPIIFTNPTWIYGFILVPCATLCVGILISSYHILTHGFDCRTIDGYDLAAVFVCLIIAIPFQVVSEKHYQLYHSIWHVGVYLASWFSIESLYKNRSLFCFKIYSSESDTNPSSRVSVSSETSRSS